MALPKNCNVLIIGGGVIGLAIARALKRKGVEDIVVIEKEEMIGKHASGRNSGVMHAGIYYQHDSLKAKYCREGSKLMQAYCHEHGLKVLKTGKAVVAKNESELNTIKSLYERSKQNGANVSIIDEKKNFRIVIDEKNNLRIIIDEKKNFRILIQFKRKNSGLSLIKRSV